jgi:hypothetical protein
VWNKQQVLQSYSAEWLVFASEHVKADVYQELLRQHVVPLVKGNNLMGAMSFGQFSASPRRHNHPATVGRILDSL